MRAVGSWLAAIATLLQVSTSFAGETGEGAKTNPPATADSPREEGASTTNATSGVAPASPLLPVRKEKPLVLAPERSSGGVAWKLGAIGLLAAVALAVGKKRGLVRLPKALTNPAMKVVSRVALGGKAELVMVEMEGQRWVLGVTPHTVSTVTVSDAPDAPAEMSESAPANENDEAIPYRPSGIQEISSNRDPVFTMRSIASLLGQAEDEEAAPESRISGEVAIKRTASSAASTSRPRATSAAHSSSPPSSRRIAIEEKASSPKETGSAPEGGKREAMRPEPLEERQVQGLKRARRTA